MTASVDETFQKMGYEICIPANEDFNDNFSYLKKNLDKIGIHLESFENINAIIYNKDIKHEIHVFEKPTQSKPIIYNADGYGIIGFLLYDDYWYFIVKEKKLTPKLTIKRDLSKMVINNHSSKFYSSQTIIHYHIDNMFGSYPAECDILLMKGELWCMAFIYLFHFTWKFLEDTNLSDIFANSIDCINIYHSKNEFNTFLDLVSDTTLGKVNDNFTKIRNTLYNCHLLLKQIIDPKVKDPRIIYPLWSVIDQSVDNFFNPSSPSRREGINYENMHRNFKNYVVIEEDDTLDQYVFQNIDVENVELTFIEKQAIYYEKFGYTFYTSDSDDQEFIYEHLENMGIKIDDDGDFDIEKIISFIENEIHIYDVDHIFHPYVIEGDIHKIIGFVKINDLWYLMETTPDRFDECFNFRDEQNNMSIAKKYIRSDDYTKVIPQNIPVRRTKSEGKVKSEAKTKKNNNILRFSSSSIDLSNKETMKIMLETQRCEINSTNPRSLSFDSIQNIINKEHFPDLTSDVNKTPTLGNLLGAIASGISLPINSPKLGSPKLGSPNLGSWANKLKIIPDGEIKKSNSEEIVRSGSSSEVSTPPEMASPPEYNASGFPTLHHSQDISNNVTQANSYFPEVTGESSTTNSPSHGGRESSHKDDTKLVPSVGDVIKITTIESHSSITTSNDKETITSTEKVIETKTAFVISNTQTTQHNFKKTTFKVTSNTRVTPSVTLSPAVPTPTIAPMTPVSITPNPTHEQIAPNTQNPPIQPVASTPMVKKVFKVNRNN